MAKNTFNTTLTVPTADSKVTEELNDVKKKSHKNEEQIKRAVEATVTPTLQKNQDMKIGVTAEKNNTPTLKK
jgi:hypothetical protein